MKYKIICLFSVLLSVYNVQSVEKKDSLFLKLIQPAQTSLFDNLNQDQIVIDGIRLILQDSVEQGLQKLSKGIKILNKNLNFDRSQDYVSKEFCEFVQIAADTVISKMRSKMMTQFLKNWFKMNHLRIEEQLNGKWRANDQETFLRVKLFYTHFNKDLKSTNKYLDELLMLTPNLLTANLLKAELLYASEKWLDSKIYFSRVLELFPNSSFALVERGLCNKELHLRDNAKEDLERAVKLTPNYTYAWNELGRIYHDVENFRKGIYYYRKAVESNPYYQWAYGNLGLCYSKIGMKDSALYYYNKALDLNPQSAKYYNNKGNVYYDDKNYGEAVYNYSKAIELVSSKDYYWKDRGNAYYYMDSMELAIKDFSKAYALNQQNDYVLKKLGDCYLARQSWTKAIGYYDKAIKIAPEYENAISSRGYCYLQLKEYNLALLDFNKSIELDPEWEYCWLSRADCWIKMKNYRAAENDLLEAGKLDPENSMCYGNLGWVYYCLGEFEKCIEYSKKAISKDEDAFYAKFNYALATLRLERFDQAKELYEKYYIESQKDKTSIEGSVADLRHLLEENILVEEVRYILEEILRQRL